MNIAKQIAKYCYVLLHAGPGLLVRLGCPTSRTSLQCLCPTSRDSRSLPSCQWHSPVHDAAGRTLPNMYIWSQPLQLALIQACFGLASSVCVVWPHTIRRPGESNGHLVKIFACGGLVNRPHQWPAGPRLWRAPCATGEHAGDNYQMKLSNRIKPYQTESN